MKFKKDTHFGERSITVPYHEKISRGTLNSILNSLSLWNNIPKKELIRVLKGKHYLQSALVYFHVLYLEI
ncbi:MAG: type II toxin-antitoxin system HicA family toxin [Candidatus Asgardarchaeia archaeon]